MGHAASENDQQCLLTLPSEAEGEWKGYTFKVAGPEDYPQVSAFLKENYYRDEPITVHLGYTEEKARDMDSVVKQFLEDRLSLYGVDNATGEVAVVRITYDSRRKLNLTSTYQTDANLKVQVAKDKLVEMAQDRLRSRYHDEIYAMGFLSSVGNLHRGKGLASEIYARSLTLYKQRGFQLTRNFFSSKITMKIVRKLGYEELSRVYLGKLRNASGELVFPGADPDFYATLMARRLDEEE